MRSIIISICILFLNYCAISHSSNDGGVNATNNNYIVHEWGVIVDNKIWTVPSEWLQIDPFLYFYSNKEITDVNVKIYSPYGEFLDTWPIIETGRQIEWNGLVITGKACNEEEIQFLSIENPNIVNDPCIHHIGEYDEITCERHHLIDHKEDLINHEASCIIYNETKAPFLFYSGTISQFQLPTIIEGMAMFKDCSPDCGIEISLTNVYNETIEDILIVYRHLREPSYIGHLWIDRLDPGVIFTENIEMAQYEDLESYIERLEEDWKAILIERELNEKEVEGFMKIWKFFMFQNELPFGLITPQPIIQHEPAGGRWYGSVYAYYVAPKSYYDDVISIEIEPPPYKLVRVGIIFQSISFVELTHN